MPNRPTIQLDRQAKPQVMFCSLAVKRVSSPADEVESMLDQAGEKRSITFLLGEVHYQRTDRKALAAYLHRLADTVLRDGGL